MVQFIRSSAVSLAEAAAEEDRRLPAVAVLPCSAADTARRPANILLRFFFVADVPVLAPARRARGEGERKERERTGRKGRSVRKGLC